MIRWRQGGAPRTRGQALKLFGGTQRDGGGKEACETESRRNP
jgi:hypothetical protein